MTRSSLILMFVLVVLGLEAQESIHHIEQDYFYPSILDNFSEQVYGVAMAEADSDLELLDEYILPLAQSSFELDETRSIDLLLESITRSNNDAERNQIRLNIGNKYFDRKDYNKAKAFYSKISPSYLEQNNDQSVNFKLGYIYLLDKNFEESESYFDKVASQVGPLTKDAQYYLGINQYYLNKVDEAVKSFEKVEDQKRYKDLIPFYLSQIYFKDEKYQEVIDYGERRLNQKSLKNKGQIYKILGLSYLATGNEVKALEYLDQYAASTSKLTENEFYQIGLLHYKQGDNKAAVSNLKQLVHQDSEIGQMANYLLGAISMREDNKQDARSAFKQSSKSTYYEDLQEESNFLYYKLSADLGEERAAIKGLSLIDKQDKYYTEAQNLVAELLLRSTDHQVALKTIEELDSKSSSMLNTYQQLSFDYALQLHENGDSKSAQSYLNTAIETPGSPQVKSEALFWSGYIADQDGDASKSENQIQKYLETGDKTYAFESQYIMAYNNIQKEKYSAAKTNFEKSIIAYNRGQDEKILFDDAVTRLADLELVDNNYKEALQYYDMAIKNKAQDADYISYQKALIYGVNSNPYDKLTTLETLIKDYPQSEYRDDALFEIGETLIELERNNEGYKVFDTLTEAMPDSEYAPKAWMRKGLISYNQGNMEAALVSYEKGLETSQNNEDQREALLAIEEIYLNELDNSDAYFKFLENEVGYTYEDITKDSISFEVAYAAYKDGEYEKSIDLLEDYTRQYKEGFFLDDAYYFQAESYVLLKQYGKGLAYYEKVLDRPGSEYSEAALRKAALIAYNHEQDFKKSYAYYDKLITTKGSKSLEYQEAALFSAFKSENCSGVEKYGPLVTENKEAADDSKGHAYFYLGKCLERLGRLDDAIQAYNKVGRHSKNNQAAEASFTVSKIFYDRGQYDSAETQAFETTKRASNYPVWVARSLILIGDIYKEKKDYLNATAAYESVIENFQENKEINSIAQRKLEIILQEIEDTSRVKGDEELDLMDIDTTGNE